MNGCTFRFNRPKFLEENTYTGTVDIACPPEKFIEVHIFSSTKHTIKVCTMDISAQNGINHVVYHNKTNGGEADDITATITAELTLSPDPAFSRRRVWLTRLR